MPRSNPFADLAEPVGDLLIEHPIFPGREERPPSGCRVCGLGERGHHQRYAGEWHKYIAPTQAQIKTRMRSRRRYLKGRAS